MDSSGHNDTFARVFARINPEQFQKSFISWIQSISKLTSQEIVAVDGKTLRHSYDSNNEKAAIHMVSAWATANRLVLGQVKVDEKSNEITAIPELLRVLCLKGCIVTIDAIGCPQEIASFFLTQITTEKLNQANIDSGDRFAKIFVIFSHSGT